MITLVLFLAALGSEAFAEDLYVFNTEAELGIVLTGGNSRTQSYNGGTLSKYKFQQNETSFNAKYLESRAGDKTNALTWLLRLRYDRNLSERLTLFLAEGLEADRFKGFLQKYTTDVGAKYSIIKNETFDWLGETGYRYTVENQTSGLSMKSHFARVFTQAEKKWSSSASTRISVEYLPNFTQSSDWQLNSEASVAAVLTSVFSIRTGFGVRYDHLPGPGVAYRADTVLTNALVAKF